MNEWNPCTYCGCAIAAGLRGAGKNPEHHDVGVKEGGATLYSYAWKNAALKEWPWLSSQNNFPEFFFCEKSAPKYWRGSKVPNYAIISELFLEVFDKVITLDQLIDWVRSVEPAEPEIPNTFPVPTFTEVEEYSCT